MSRKKPDSKKNFFQNYQDHTTYLQSQFFAVKEKFDGTKARHKVAYVGKQLVARINCLDPLRDGHDYMDEVLGATSVPLIAGVVAIAAAGTALLYSVCSFFDAKSNWASEAKMAFAVAGIAAAVALFSFAKSFISLFTRPIATVLNGGPKPQDTNRFGDSLVGDLMGDKRSVIAETLSAIRTMC